MKNERIETVGNVTRGPNAMMDALSTIIKNEFNGQVKYVNLISIAKELPKEQSKRSPGVNDDQKCGDACGWFSNCPEGCECIDTKWWFISVCKSKKEN